MPDLGHHLSHPIDLVEDIAQHHAWEFDRITRDDIAMVVEGLWRSYTVTLSWSPEDEALRLFCTFEMEPPPARLAALYEVLNLINDRCWAGSFSWWPDHQMMAFKYALFLAGGQQPCTAQVDMMIATAISNAERYYPALQMATWGEKTPSEALRTAITEVHGHA
ncbi:conserved hypothetical protein [Ketogulonicigenium vulgare Y25]|uniref:Prolipoprotein diacylglyceryl transferase n=1 Tax=Ketogulonicigenium vulgare (strain WSH-001) TaxID=759362 RepID=F9Y9V5_KETVW|nr:YbjN domain-containing protein [Ketogulonicigenium vulgare]ADO41987.1 conserved hypothetical protein [Ketogulonicigenium vulgare Y25]AEM40207.1 Prolipoprotein diacylglyceryl transferase [Ketogulonicigenium vulgare WSH-001]AOZ53911.1 hypothetical protein KVC_0894 [Ketogulonicigenium vulgare]